MWYQACLQPSRTERGQPGMVACWMQVANVGLHRWRRSVVGPSGNSEGVQSSGQWTKVRLHPSGRSTVRRWAADFAWQCDRAGHWDISQTKYYSTCTLMLPADLLTQSHPLTLTHLSKLPIDHLSNSGYLFAVLRHSHYVTVLHVNPEAPGHSESSRQARLRRAS